MTAKMLFESAMLNLGYRQTDEMLTAAIAFINQVCADIAALTGAKHKPISSLSEKLQISDSVASNVALYGLAMFLALHRGDGDKNRFYANLYNQKRRLLSTSTQRTDLLPKGED